MKKFLILAITSMSLCSCAVTFDKVMTTTHADITWMNDAGETVRHWDGATIQEDVEVVTSTNGVATNSSSKTASAPFKNGNWLSFYNSDGRLVMLNGGMTIIENVSTETSVKLDPSKEKKLQKDARATEIAQMYEYRKQQKKTLKNALKDAAPEDVDNLKKDIAELKNEMNKLNMEYRKLTGMYIR